jgi:hypothetical protein
LMMFQNQLLLLESMILAYRLKKRQKISLMMFHLLHIEKIRLILKWKNFGWYWWISCYQACFFQMSLKK